MLKSSCQSKLFRPSLTGSAVCLFPQLGDEPKKSPASLQGFLMMAEWTTAELPFFLVRTRRKDAR